MESSREYQEVPPEEKDSVWDRLENAWHMKDVPFRQWEVTRKERDQVRAGDFSLPVYATFLELIRLAGFGPGTAARGVLEIGASNAWYNELLRLAGIACRYEGLDYAEGFREHVREIYPGLPYTVGNAMALPFESRSKDTVVSGSCILHCRDWRLAAREAARVASRYVIFTRTPVSRKHPTKLFQKLAYDVPCLEWRFAEDDVLLEFTAAGLRLLAVRKIFGDDDYAHISYLLEAPRG